MAIGGRVSHWVPQGNGNHLRPKSLGNQGKLIDASGVPPCHLQRSSLSNMTSSESPGAPGHSHHQAFWLWVMCLTGVDYFSTLGYQPSIAFENAGMLAPLATVVLVLVTLFGALPVYSYVAKQSPHGQGSIAMLEKLMSGWSGKLTVLFLLGFAATDFVITKTLSAADAAEHVIHNPIWINLSPTWLQAGRGQLILTMFLLVMLGAMFLRGFAEVIYVAVTLVAIYLLLNVIVIGSGVFYVFTHAELITQWWTAVKTGGEAWHMEHSPFDAGTSPSWLVIWLVCGLIFPKLALGLSGFETGIAVMPLVKGDDDDDPHQPHGRIRNTRRLLVSAAVIMSVMLLGSSFVVATLIEPIALRKVHEVEAPITFDEPSTTEEKAEEAAHSLEGKAANRAIAFLAHGESHHTGINPLFGEVFGTIYDISTVLILWFAGASAMSGLLNLVPQYLPRYGMAPEWAKAIRPLVVLFTVINLFVTWVFGASVEAQGAAYATGVLVLMSSASIASVIDIYRHRSGSWFGRVSWPFVVISIIFVYTTIDIIIEKPTGMLIASFFIGAVLISSLVSRVMRSTELRLTHFEFVNQESKFLWDSLKHIEIPILVPHRPGRRELLEKERDILEVHRLAPGTPIVFVEAIPSDTSEFSFTPLMEIHSEDERFIIRVTRCASIAHVIAAIGLEIGKQGHPPEIHFGWSDEMPLAANLKFVLFGEGNVPWMVRELILKAQPDPRFQPRIVIG